MVGGQQVTFYPYLWVTAGYRCFQILAHNSRDSLFFKEDSQNPVQIYANESRTYL